MLLNFILFSQSLLHLFSLYFIEIVLIFVTAISLLLVSSQNTRNFTILKIVTGTGV